MKTAIKNKGKTEEIYDMSFAAFGSNNVLVYYLVYFTSHLKGLKVMKETMFAVSKDRSYKFSDFDFDLIVLQAFNTASLLFLLLSNISFMSSFYHLLFLVIT